MKNVIKSIAIVALLLGTSGVLNAQEGRVNTLDTPSFGLKGGFNMSNLYVEDVDDENVLFGFNVGMFVEMPLTSVISLQPELALTTKGSEVTYDNAFAEGSTKFRLTYVEVPLLLRANITRNFNVHFGPYAAYLVNSKITNENADGDVTGEEEIDEDDLNRFDIGLAAGIGLEFGGIGVGARYNYGLTTVGKERTFLGETYTTPDGKNSVLSIFATIKL